MKRDFLKGLGISDDLIDQIMGEHGKTVSQINADLERHKQDLAARDTEIEGLKGQLTQRDTDITALRDGIKDADTVKSQLAELQNKYKTDTDELNKKLKEQQEGFARQTATDRFFADVKFSSALAREAALAKFAEKKLKLENGTFTGATEWLNDLKKNSPDAFAKEDTEPEPPKPSFGGSMNNAGKPGNQNPFSFSFGTVRPVPQK